MKKSDLKPREKLTKIKYPSLKEKRCDEKQQKQQKQRSTQSNNIDIGITNLLQLVGPPPPLRRSTNF